MAAIDLRPKFGLVEKQGNGNACVSHAVTSALEATLGVADLSRLFVYYNARALAGQQATDAGCQPRNAVKAVQQLGAPPEGYWPYDYSRLAVKPSADAYSAALPLSGRIKAYQSVLTLDAMKQAMLAGQPVVFGMLVPDSFVTVAAYQGYLPMYNSSTKWLGRHAMCTAGFDDATRNVIIRNSYGPTWGNGGYCTMSYDWFTNLNSYVSDCWTFVAAK